MIFENCFLKDEHKEKLCTICGDVRACRCQAFAITGDAAATDPVCHLSPHHHLVEQQAAMREDVPYVYRRG